MPEPLATLERIIPHELEQGSATGSESLKLHVERYAYAGRFLRSGRVLDIACGVGYGSQSLAQDGNCAVVGVDLSAETIAMARDQYAHPRVQFIQGNCMDFHDSHGFDAVVSLETLEHLPDPAGFLRNIVPQIRRGGYFVASVPITPSMDFNPYHAQDFTAKSFRQLVKDAGLAIEDTLLQIQRFKPVAALRRRESRMADARRGLLRYFVRRPNKLARRAWSTLRDGFCNKYLTLACRRL